MSDDPVTLVRDALEAAARLTESDAREFDPRDPATVRMLTGFLDEDIEFHEDPRFPEAGVYRGIESVTRYWTQFSDSFDRFTFVVEDVVSAGSGRALVLLRIRAQGRGSEAIDETRSAWVCAVAGGKAVRIHAFLDRDDALAFVNA